MHWRFLAEWEACWRELLALLDEQKSAWDRALLWRGSPGRIATLRELFEQDAAALLNHALAAFQRSRLLDRLTEALEALRRQREELVRALPASLCTSGSELVAVLASDARVRWYRRAWIAWRDKACSLAFQDLARQAMENAFARRARWQTAFVRLFAAQALELPAPWEGLLREALGRLSGKKADSRPVRRAGVRWLRRLARGYRRGACVLEKLRADGAALATRLADAIFRGACRAAKPTGELAKRLEQDFERCVLAARAAADQLRLSEALLEAARATVEEAARSLESLCQEQRDLIHELDALILWLEQLEDGVSGAVAPPPQAEILAGSQRHEAWLEAVEARLRYVLPESIEVSPRPRSVFCLRGSVRQTAVRKPLLDDLRQLALSEALPAFRQAESQHRAALDDIERARKVVQYSRETFEPHGSAEADLAREAVANALSLIRHRRSTFADVTLGVESALCRVIAAAFRRGQLLWELRRDGVLGRLRRQGLPDTVSVGAVLLSELVRRCHRRTLDLLAGSLRYRAMRRRTEPRWPPKPRVLPRTPADPFPAASAAAEGSQLYRRLFELAPLEDPRLLVGREAELAAFAAARDRWLAGRPASILVVGPPGSGRTSLLNCAALRLFASTEVIRGAFHRRIRTAAEMRDFLRGLLRLSPDQPVDAEALGGRRRVVMLEELERSFFRRPGGYEGLRFLLRLISSTSHAVLWVCTVNHACFQLLEPLLGLSGYFALRIDASAVRPDEIEEAIMLRHRLSGLRLQVSLPPSAPGVRALLRRAAPQDPQRELFGLLHRQSEGIYRQALQVWLDSIERIEGGFVHIRVPAPSQVAATIASLPIEFLFSLLAILQHGGLDVSEHAELFGLAQEDSRARLEALQEAGLVQPAGELGYCLAPRATLEVERALKNRNLL